MGLIIDVTPRVSVELRRESFILTVGTDADYDSAEFLYEDADGILLALREVMGRKRADGRRARK